MNLQIQQMDFEEQKQVQKELLEQNVKELNEVKNQLKQFQHERREWQKDLQKQQMDFEQQKQIQKELLEQNMKELDEVKNQFKQFQHGHRL